MTFSAALHALKEGHRIRRRIWPDGRVMWMDASKWPQLCDRSAPPNVTEAPVYAVSAENLIAEDWVIA